MRRCAHPAQSLMPPSSRALLGRPDPLRNMRNNCFPWIVSPIKCSAAPSGHRCATRHWSLVAPLQVVPPLYRCSARGRNPCRGPAASLAKSLSSQFRAPKIWVLRLCVGQDDPEPGGADCRCTCQAIRHHMHATATLACDRSIEKVQSGAALIKDRRGPWALTSLFRAGHGFGRAPRRRQPRWRAFRSRAARRWEPGPLKLTAEAHARNWIAIQHVQRRFRNSAGTWNYGAICTLVLLFPIRSSDITADDPHLRSVTSFSLTVL